MEIAVLLACPRRAGITFCGESNQSHLGPTLKTRLGGDPLKTPMLYTRSKKEGRYPRGAVARSLVCLLGCGLCVGISKCAKCRFAVGFS